MNKLLVLTTIELIVIEIQVFLRSGNSFFTSHTSLDDFRQQWKLVFGSDDGLSMLFDESKNCRQSAISDV